MYGCFACVCMSVYHLCAQCPLRPEKGKNALGTGVEDSCEMPCRYWESSPDSLEEHPVLLIAKPFILPRISWLDG